MTTIIRRNGPRLAGSTIDTTIDQLIEALAHEPLDPKFEDFGGFVMACSPAFLDAVDADRIGLSRHTLHFWGNFHEISHGFDILTDDGLVIVRLMTAIKANQATPAYRDAVRERIDEKQRIRARRESFRNQRRAA